MDEEREEGDPTPKTALSGEPGRRSKAKSPAQQQRADSPGPSGVSMKSDRSMDLPHQFKDGYHQPSKKSIPWSPNPCLPDYPPAVAPLLACHRTPACLTLLPVPDPCLSDSPSGS
ncbi:unnamed protein product [Gadus morhua 'NCC']